jgi:N-acetylglutamate synthase-like GNAT family acetyltransferase
MTIKSRIRPAEHGEAEELSSLAWHSMEYWEYSIEEMKGFYALLEVTEEFIEENPTYVMEDGETGELLGFYSIGSDEDGFFKLKNLWVAPDHIGTGIGGTLFLDACETAETMGAEEMLIISNPHAEAFFVEMGAERAGEKKVESDTFMHKFPMLKIKL